VTPPPAKPAPKVQAAAPKAEAPAPKAAPAAKAPPPAKPAAAKPAPGAKTAGVAAVQIGAFSSQALADKGWSDAAAIAPGPAVGKGKSVEKVEKDGHTLFRTQVTGFASRGDASAFCGRLKAAGKACFVK
jgi:cell division septation protein DedD